MKFRVVRLTVAAALALAGLARAESVSLTDGSIYQQNFDSLASTGSGSALPAGWAIKESGTSSAVNGSYTAGIGSGTTGDTYSFGSAGSTDRALGILRSGTLDSTFGAFFTNNTGSAITSLAIAYTGEQWRNGGSGNTDALDFSYATNRTTADASALTTGAWTGVSRLSFTSPQNGTPSGALDGNAAANRTALAGSITGLNIAPGSTFAIRWTTITIPSGSHDGLAADDLSLTPTLGSPSPVPLPTTVATGCAALACLAAGAAARRRSSRRLGMM